LEEIEISGEGELIMFSSTMLPAAKFSEEPKSAYGIVKLKEGPVFLTKVEGFDISRLSHSIIREVCRVNHNIDGLVKSRHPVEKRGPWVS